MEKLKELLENHSRWKPLNEYVSRIEAYRENDFSFCIENTKSLLEAIGKEICNINGVEIEDKSTVNGVVKQAFKSLGYSSNNSTRQISSALASIGQCIGEIRNEIGITSHGKTLQEIEDCNEKIDDFSKAFLIDSVELIACLLINLVESKLYKNASIQDVHLLYEDCEDFNDYWDGNYNELIMGDYSFCASEILYTMDYEAYKTELNAYNDIKESLDE